MVRQAGAHNGVVRIIIPAFNEERNLGEAVLGFYSALGGRKVIFYVVNDGSTDRTKEVVKRLSRRYPVRLLDHLHNQGIARVFATAFKYVLGRMGDDDLVFLVEGDGTSDPKLLPTMVRLLRSGSDVVIASRYVNGGGYRNFPWKRRMLSVTANLLLRSLLRVKGVRDYTIFYRGYRPEPLRKMQQTLGGIVFRSEGFSANVELLCMLAPYAGKITEVPFVYDYGLKKSRSGLRIFLNLLSYTSLFWKR